eukprot:Hpha_TRINITY_DN16562_c3_g1::TRINITY_DN16562_c3_g1_i1::g.134116::m.134116
MGVDEGFHHLDQRAMSLMSETFLSLESETVTTVIHGTFGFEAVLSREAVLEGANRVAQRLFRFRSRVDRARRTFIEVPGFDASAVVREETVDGIRNNRDVEDFTSLLIPEPFPSDKPMWSLHLLHVPNHESLQTVVIMRVSHCVGDGVSLSAAVAHFFDHVGEEEGHKVYTGSRRSKKTLPFWLMIPLKVLLFVWATLVAFITPFLPADPFSPVKGAPTTSKRLLSSRRIPVADVKRVGAPHGATVNDVMVSCVGGGLRRYCKGQLPWRHLRMLVPINLEGANPKDLDKRMGNRFGLYVLPLHVHESDAVQRLEAVTNSTWYMKLSLESVILLTTNKVMHAILPYPVYERLTQFYTGKFTCTCTNVPGPSKPLALRGNVCREMTGFVPPGLCSLAIVVFSYCDKLTLGLYVDDGVVERPEELLSSIMAEWEELLERADGCSPAAVSSKKSD